MHYHYEEIGYYGKPINSLTREELLEAFAELAVIIYECSVKDKKFEEFIFIKKDESISFEKYKKNKIAR